jgi:hypothetical protein
MIADFKNSRRLLQLKGNHTVRFLIRAELHIFYPFFSLIVNRRFQMSLTQRFREALSDLTVSVSALRHEKRYSVTQAMRIETLHGKRVVMTLIQDGDDRVNSVSCQNDTETQWRTVIYITLTLDVYNII